MFILNKKRIMLIFTCLFASIFLASIKMEKQTIKTVALPVENKVIILDAGHGSPDERSF